MNRLSPHHRSLVYGLLGVLGFSLTLPATRMAVAGLDPVFVGLGRAVVAALLAGGVLLATRSRLPSPGQWLRLAGVALGVVVGFPLLSTWAMTLVPASHGAVVVGLLPLATALFGAWLAGERPRPLFWISTLIGSLTIAGFSLSGGQTALHSGDLLLLGAVLAAGFGYAEGARLARTLGAWQTISWALLLSAPLLLLPALQTAPAVWSAVPWSSWAGFAYVGVVSMYLAFVVWYQGLALGGIGRVGQLQLLQPFLTILAAAALLGETIHLGDVAAAVIVVACVLVGRRSPPAPDAVPAPAEPPPEALTPAEEGASS